MILSNLFLLLVADTSSLPDTHTAGKHAGLRLDWD